MSIDVMSRVWRHSQTSSGYLMVLLAIADHANDDGSAYPSIEGLAFKARMTERNVQRAIKHLVKIGELKVQYNQGPQGKNLFTVLTTDKMSPRRPRRRVANVTIKGGIGDTPPSMPPKSSVFVVKHLKPSIKKHPPTPHRGKRAPDELFEKFWQAYPNKKAKQAALKAWNILKPTPKLSISIAEALNAHISSEQWQRGFIPHAATWLNGRRWEDELTRENVAPAPSPVLVEERPDEPPITEEERQETLRQVKPLIEGFVGRRIMPPAEDDVQLRKEAQLRKARDAGLQI